MFRKSFGAIALVMAALMAGAGAPAFADLPRQPVLSLDVAMKMVDACVDKATAEGLKVNIFVMDGGDNPVAFARMDGAQLSSVAIARAKADFSAKSPRATSTLAKQAFDAKSGTPNALAFVDGYIALPGGLPILTADGTHIGGIGVSGSTGAQDEGCAQAALDAVKNDLK